MLHIIMNKYSSGGVQRGAERTFALPKRERERDRGGGLPSLY